MQHNLEYLIKKVYKKWKSQRPKMPQLHPDEESMICFLEGRLSSVDEANIKAHLLECDRCTEVVAIQAKLKIAPMQEVPEGLIKNAKSLVLRKEDLSILEIILKLKERALEIINTNGDVLVGREFMPAPVLRSHKIKDFKDEVTILKDFLGLRVEIKIEQKRNEEVNVIVLAREKETQKVIKDLRITLVKGDLELESYLVDSGRVVFEHVLLGKYTIEIATRNERLASVLVDIRI